MLNINNEIDLSSFKEKFKSGFFDDELLEVYIQLMLQFIK